MWLLLLNLVACQEESEPGACVGELYVASGDLSDDAACCPDGTTLFQCHPTTCDSESWATTCEPSEDLEFWFKKWCSACWLDLDDGALGVACYDY